MQRERTQSESTLVGGPLAQLAEQRTFNPWVVGSSPTGPTARSLIILAQIYL
jgi:hypothetical protein